MFSRFPNIIRSFPSRRLSGMGISGSVTSLLSRMNLKKFFEDMSHWARESINYYSFVKGLALYRHNTAQGRRYMWPLFQVARSWGSDAARWLSLKFLSPLRQVHCWQGRTRHHSLRSKKMDLQCNSNSYYPRASEIADLGLAFWSSSSSSWDLFLLFISNNVTIVTILANCDNFYQLWQFLPTVTILT